MVRPPFRKNSGVALTTSAASPETSIKEQNKLKVERYWATKKRIEEIKARIEVTKTELRAYGWTNAQIQYVLETPMEQIAEDQENMRRAAKAAFTKGQSGEHGEKKDAAKDAQALNRSKSRAGTEARHTLGADASKAGKGKASASDDADLDDDGGVKLPI